MSRVRLVLRPTMKPPRQLTAGTAWQVYVDTVSGSTYCIAFGWPNEDIPWVFKMLCHDGTGRTRGDPEEREYGEVYWEPQGPASKDLLAEVGGQKIEAANRAAVRDASKRVTRPDISDDELVRSINEYYDRMNREAKGVSAWPG